MKKSVGKGAFVLIVSGVVCKFFGALFRLPLTNIVGIEGIGIFQMIMSLYSLLLVLVTSGVSVTLSKLVSSARASGEEASVKKYIASSLVFTLSLSLILALFIFLFARSIASVQGIGQGYASYYLFFALIPLSALIGVFRGVFQGYENMTPTAISQILEQVFKFVCGLFFAYFFSRYGAAQGVFGAFLGIVVSEVVAFLFLLVSYSKTVKIKVDFSQGLSSKFFSAVIPLTFSSAIVPFTHTFDSLIITSRLVKAGFSEESATALFGLQTGVVGAILNFPLIISFSVATALLPNISFLAGQGNLEGAKASAGKAFCLMWYLLLPLVFGVMVISGNIYSLVYPNVIEGYLLVAKELSFWGGISIILSAVMQFYLSILQATGHFKYYLVTMILGGIVKVVTVYFLAAISEIGIIALPLSNIFLSLIVLILVLIKLKNLVHLPYFEVLTPLLSAVVMYLGVKIFLSFSHLSNILSLLLAVVLGGAIYVVLTLPILRKYWVMIKGSLAGRKKQNKKTF